MAADNSVTFGASGLQILNLEYERNLTPNVTINLDYGLSFMGLVTFSDEPEWPCYGIGVNWYFKDHAFTAAILAYTPLMWTLKVH
ncbi:MAG TPA: hypothetical protein VIM29_11310 [Bacillota bacterium]